MGLSGGQVYSGEQRPQSWAPPGWEPTHSFVHPHGPLSKKKNQKPLSDHFLKVFIEFIIILLLFYVLAFWLQSTWDLISPTRDQIHMPCTGRGSLNHWTARSATCLSSQALLAFRSVILFETLRSYSRPTERGKNQL